MQRWLHPASRMMKSNGYICLFENKSIVRTGEPFQVFRSFAKQTKKDHYAVLGVAKTATQQEIKHAYYKLSRIHHPDRNEGSDYSVHEFRLITEAYEVLSSSNKRKFYDRSFYRRRSYARAHAKAEEGLVVYEEVSSERERRGGKRIFKMEKDKTDADRLSEDMDKSCTASFQETQSIKFRKEELRRENMRSDPSSDTFVSVIPALLLFGAILLVAIIVVRRKSNENTSSKTNKKR